MTKKLNKSELLDIAVVAIKQAELSAQEFKALNDQLAKTGEVFASRVEVACAESYKASMAGVSGADIARGAGVSEMTVSRYIAGGHVAFISKGKIAGGKVVSDIGNGNISVSRAKSVKSASEYNKTVTANKKTAKAGKAKAKATEPTASNDPLKAMEALIGQIVEMVRTNQVELEDVLGTWAEAMATLENTDELLEV